MTDEDVVVTAEPDCEDEVTGAHDEAAETEATSEPVADVEVEADAAAGLGPRGGGWGGAEAPVNVARAIGLNNRLRVMSRKRSTGSTGSDHHVSQRRSDAIDLSNGTSPTPEMDRVAAAIAARLGVPNWRGGVLERRVNGYRVQLLYRTNVGGNHFNHVHVGVRVG